MVLLDVVLVGKTVTVTVVIETEGVAEVILAEVILEEVILAEMMDDGVCAIAKGRIPMASRKNLGNMSVLRNFTRTSG